MSLKLPPPTIEWVGDLDGHVALIDQTQLPDDLLILEVRDLETMYEAIQSLRVRGAPAIGIAAAMGVVLGIRDFDPRDHTLFLDRLGFVCDTLAESRPTAVNLVWALNRMRRIVTEAQAEDLPRLRERMLEEARCIRDEDEAMCQAIGRHGEPLVHAGAGILTHCNAGSLATARYGTALAPLYVAHEQGRRFHVYVDETRPLLQGARLTAWELQRAGIETTLLCDNAAGSLLAAGKIDLIITGADRIAANGDLANKIGTYGLAVLAQAHSVPFYVAAPVSTFDLSLADGSQIPIEMRDPEEIRHGFGKRTAPADISCYTPAFDVTPARLVRAILTDRGIIEPVNRERIAAAVA